MSDKLKITDLIAKAEANRDRKKDRQEIFVKSLGTIVIEEPDNAVIMEASDMDGTDADAYLIYRCVVETGDMNSVRLLFSAGNEGIDTLIVKIIYSLKSLTHRDRPA